MKNTKGPGGGLEKALLLILPCLAIVAASLVLIPQLLKIFSPPRQEYVLIENIQDQVEVADAMDLLPEIKTGTESAPQEAVPEIVEPDDTGLWGWQTGEDGALRYFTDDGTMLRGLKYIGDRIYYFDENGVCAKSVGVDVSFYNGTVDWKALKKAGVRFALLRVGGRGWGSGGTLYDDTFFFRYLNGAKAAGLEVGVYFYSSAVNVREAVEEASLTVDRLRGFALDLPVFFDTELSGNYPNGRADPLATAQRMEIVKAFCTVIESAGYEAGVYASESFLVDELHCDALPGCCIWMASYTENNALPSGTVSWDIWQFTDRGRLPGISGSCDINVMF